MTPTSCQCGFVAYHLAHPELRARDPKPGTSGVYDALAIMKPHESTTLHVIVPLSPEKHIRHHHRVRRCALT